MATAPSNLQFVDWHYTVPTVANHGGWGPFALYSALTWDENETDPSFYRVEVHVPVAVPELGWVVGWNYVRDVPKGTAKALGIRVGMQTSNQTTGVWTRTALIDDARVTCFTIPDDASPGVESLGSYALPVLSHSSADNPSIFCYGKVGAATGSIVVSWEDDSTWLAQVIPTLVEAETNTVLPRTSALPIVDPANPIYPNHKTGPDASFRVSLTKPPVFGQPPNPANYIKDGDLLSLKIATMVLVDGNPYPFTILTVFSFPYYREVTILPSIDPGTVNQAYSKTIQVLRDSLSTPDPVGIFSAIDLPPGLTCSTAGVISGTPTTAGTYRFTAICVSKGNVTSYEYITLQINPAVTPVINSPTSPVALKTLTPASIQLAATANPSSFAVVSGTLPVGLSLDTATGLITGTPTTPVSAAVVFKATNTLGDSPNYEITFDVTALVTPTINSVAALTAYLNEGINYVIATTVPATGWAAVGLPTGLVSNNNTITGAPLSTVIPGVYQVRLTATNAAGTGPEFILALTVAVRAPAISSALSVPALVGAPFSYQIAASHIPTTFSASGLPDGLSINATGLISGTPSTIGTANVAITASNAGGTDNETLIITVTLPQKPVIDATIAKDRTITAKSGIGFTFQPAASNQPTSWTAAPVPLNLTFDPLTGTIGGLFDLPGLYAIVFNASNIGGISDPVTFYFLVEQGPPSALAANSVGVDMWIELGDGSATFQIPSTGPKELTVKRGDTSEITIHFHKGEYVVDIVPSSLKLGARVTHDEDYVLFTDTFSRVSKGAYRINPDFSGNNAQLDSDLNQEKLTLLCEVQWETADPATRRTTQTFSLVVLRDLVHPD